MTQDLRSSIGDILGQLMGQDQEVQQQQAQLPQQAQQAGTSFAKTAISAAIALASKLGLSPSDMVNILLGGQGKQQAQKLASEAVAVGEQEQAAGNATPDLGVILGKLKDMFETETPANPGPPAMTHEVEDQEEPEIRGNVGSPAATPEVEGAEDANELRGNVGSPAQNTGEADSVPGNVGPEDSGEEFGLDDLLSAARKLADRYLDDIQSQLGDQK